MTLWKDLFQDAREEATSLKLETRVVRGQKNTVKLLKTVGGQSYEVRETNQEKTTFTQRLGLEIDRDETKMAQTLSWLYFDRWDGTETSKLLN